MKRLKNTIRFLFVQHRIKSLSVLFLLGLVYWFSLPSPLFDEPTCMVLEASNKNLLGAKIAADGQWRFPYIEEVPNKFAAALIEFEDKRFYSHPGFDPAAFTRAFFQNIRRGKIVSGGSTISMQVIRLSRKMKSRTVFEKLVEIILATRLEISYSKQEILALYASNAPFGGNVVGLEAASWRYYGKNLSTLSWSEAATLAVLPNSPALIHPGRNRQALEDKRNRLLAKLLKKGKINKYTYELAIEEPLPDKPHPLPRMAPHLLERALREHFKNKKETITRLRTSIDFDLQGKVNAIANRRNRILKNNEINNLAILVLDIKTGKVLSYIGNAPNAGNEHGESVDIITSPRSTGSILKPILYGLMLQEGKILPGSLVSDIPTQLFGYRPENYLETYDGVVPCEKAVARSLNVPFVKMLQDYGVEKLLYQLKKLGMTTLNKPASHYGLTLILGGAEGSLWDMTNLYACMGRVLNHHYEYNGFYDKNDFHQASYLSAENAFSSSEEDLLKEPPFLSSDAIWLTLLAMNEVERPNSEGDWERFESSQRVAWKTGTSFGFRDAWAIGLTSKYVVGIWVGNADGEGRPGLMGVYSAAPILFEVIDLLPQSQWFLQPYDAMRKVAICKESGYLPLDICPIDTIWACRNSLNVIACPYHKRIHTDSSGKWQVNSRCELPWKMLAKTWFILPPVEEYYFKSKNPNYKTIPPFRKDCIVKVSGEDLPMQLIYPKQPTKIYVPIDLDGNLSRTVFKAAHRNQGSIIYWHLDKSYLGQTSSFHEMELNPTPGEHVLTLVDSEGFRLEQKFEMLVRK
jgi:penicillin-binding protein 1C